MPVSRLFYLPVLLLAVLPISPSRAQSDTGSALAMMEGRWTSSHCGDPGVGTWAVFGDRIQFDWPNNDPPQAVERVLRQTGDVVETEIISPPWMKGRQYRYHVRRDKILIQNLTDNREQIVTRCR